ncbi:MAG: hypothetical protein Q7K44_02305 [Candidatus Liptonbacteria bacterium]|nr:hypothetical protein [Candidatus Liptonbacteria bacterium]
MLDTFKKATPEAIAAIHEEMKVRRTDEVFLLFAMGSQFDHLILQMFGKLGVYCLVADPASVKMEDILRLNPKGIIGSGGPASVITEPPPFDSRIFDMGIPFLGICLAFQMWAKHIGIRVSAGSEFGVHEMKIVESGKLFDGCKPVMQVLQSHGERVETDERLTVLGMTDGILSAASYRHLYGVQFHPEVTDTVDGKKIFENFCFKICGAKNTFPAHDIAKQKIEKVRKELDGHCLLHLLSGGSDSSVVAYLIKEALQGERRVRAIYIKGIDRPEDEAFVIKYFGNQPWIDLKIVNATERFLKAFSSPSGVFQRFWWWLIRKKTPITMKEKRLAMRGVYKAIAEEEATKYSAEMKMPVKIGQGTLYTDISESGGGHTTPAPVRTPTFWERCRKIVQMFGLKRKSVALASVVRKAVIKIHHNVKLGFKFPELTPLDDCVKDGARNIGREIGVPEELLTRHPFPGPGLAVRIEGEITREKLAMARQLDGIYIEELRLAGQYEKVWQAAAVVTSSVHTWTKGDDAGSGHVIAIWAVWSENGFTAQAANLPFDFRNRLSRRIGNEVRGVGAVVERISGKPFSTIEWG